MGCVYRIINNINGKCYVGYTTRPIEERMRKHKNDDIGRGTILGKAINKYGWNNFTYESLFESESKETLLDMEQYYIQYYNSYKPNGYNMTLGGECLFEENNPFFGHNHSIEIRQMLSEMASKRKGEANPFFGRHHSSNTKKKISESNSKPVNALIDNCVVASFSSLLNAANWCIENGLTIDKTASSTISKRCRDGKRAYGYNWEYSSEDVETMADECKPVG